MLKDIRSADRSADRSTYIKKTRPKDRQTVLRMDNLADRDRDCFAS